METVGGQLTLERKKNRQGRSPIVTMKENNLSRVRVIVPTYNRASLLVRAIDSVLGQSFSNFELIVSNDGSTDETMEILQQKAETDSRIKALNNSNGGPAHARNLAIEFPGEYDFVAFLDDDDEWMPYHLERSLPLFEASPEVNLVFSKTNTYDSTGIWTEEKFQRRAEGARRPIQFSSVSPWAGCFILDNLACRKAMLTEAFNPQPSTVIVRRSSVTRKHWFNVDLEILEDLELYLYLITMGSAFGFLDSFHANINYQGDNLTGGLLDLTSPILARRYKSVLQFMKLKKKICVSPEEYQIVKKQIGTTAYFLGQCFAEQLNLSMARQYYKEALDSGFSWPALKGYLLAHLPVSLWSYLRVSRSKMSYPRK